MWSVAYTDLFQTVVIVAGLILVATLVGGNAGGFDKVVALAAADGVLVAGKGHEDYQEISGVKHPFSDVQHARKALAQRAENGRTHV